MFIIFTILISCVLGSIIALLVDEDPRSPSFDRGGNFKKPY